MDLKAKNADELNEMVINKIQELERKGMVDSNFMTCHMMKDSPGSRFFGELVITFVNDSQLTVSHMMKILNPMNVDFDELRVYNVKIKGGSASIGACRVREACLKMDTFINKKSRAECLLEVKHINDEYNVLKDQLLDLMKIEREIVHKLEGGTRS